jgi:GT2 family glycosyltransferase
VGFLDERFFMYWEDVEFGRRLRLRGIPIVEDRRAFVVHEISASHSKASYRIDAYSALGAVVYARIAGRGNLLGVCLRIGARVLRRLASCEFRRALAVLEGTILGMRVRGSAADVVEAWNGRQR